MEVPFQDRIAGFAFLRLLSLLSRKRSILTLQCLGHIICVFQRMPSKQRCHTSSGSPGYCASRVITVHLHYQFARHFLPAKHLTEIWKLLKIDKFVTAWLKSGRSWYLAPWFLSSQIQLRGLLLFPASYRSQVPGWCFLALTSRFCCCSSSSPAVRT